jgi:hypothetical protein
MKRFVIHVKNKYLAHWTSDREWCSRSKYSSSPDDPDVEFARSVVAVLEVERFLKEKTKHGFDISSESIDR